LDTAQKIIGHVYASEFFSKITWSIKILESSIFDYRLEASDNDFFSWGSIGHQICQKILKNISSTKLQMLQNYPQLRYFDYLDG
jgi:hypothetical protein